jgi:hypothetical protein
MSLKNPVLPPGTDPGTARLVAQRLNHYATPGPTVEVPTVNMAEINSTKVTLMKKSRKFGATLTILIKFFSILDL